MNNLSAPPVPDPGNDWIAARRRDLVREIATPHRRRVSRRFALSGVGVLAAVGAATVAVLLAFAGTGVPNAFAGWTATPTTPTSGETARALAQCTSRLANSAGGQSGGPGGGWQALLTDTRGPFTAVILRSGDATATCLSGPSFTTTQANAAQGGASQHVLSNGSVAAGQAPAVSILGLGGSSSSGPIVQAAQSQLTTSGGQPYTFVQGQVAADVTGVTLALSNGPNVQATVADGSFLAWWPGRATATSARVASASGVTTQQLVFTPVPEPTAPATSASRSQAEAVAHAVAFAVCMRSHGVPNFPRPQISGSNGGIHAAVRGSHGARSLNPRSPALISAQRTCLRLLPNGQ